MRFGRCVDMPIIKTPGRGSGGSITATPADTDNGPRSAEKLREDIAQAVAMIEATRETYHDWKMWNVVSLWEGALLEHGVGRGLRGKELRIALKLARARGMQWLFRRPVTSTKELADDEIMALFHWLSDGTATQEIRIDLVAQREVHVLLLATESGDSKQEVLWEV